MLLSIRGTRPMSRQLDRIGSDSVLDDWLKSTESVRSGFSWIVRSLGQGHMHNIYNPTVQPITTVHVFVRFINHKQVSPAPYIQLCKIREPLSGTCYLLRTFLVVNNLQQPTILWTSLYSQHVRTTCSTMKLKDHKRHLSCLLLGIISNKNGYCNFCANILTKN